VGALDNIPASIGYRLARMVRELNKELVTIEGSRLELIKKYGSETSPDQFQVKPENMVTFMQDFNAVLDEEIDMDISPVTIPGDSKIKVSSLVDLYEFVKVEGE